MKLKNKVAIVTGGSRDIGKAVSLKLAAEGASVVVNYFSNAAQGAETVAEIEAAGGKAIAVAGDMTKADDVANLVAESQKAFGESIDILVNNVGGMVERKTIEEMDEEFFNYVMQLNLTSTFLTTKAARPHMGSGSAIVNLASLAGRDGGWPGCLCLRHVERCGHDLHPRHVEGAGTLEYSCERGLSRDDRHQIP